MPVVGPHANLATVKMVPAHYTAASHVNRDTAEYLRAIQRDYTVNRGYSIGYNFAVDQDGVAWECRGFDIKCAANKDFNEQTLAILCLVDGDQPMNDAMCVTFRALAFECQQRCNRPLDVVGHRDIGSTACPGDGIYSQVLSGILDPEAEPAPQPPQEDDDMVPFLIRDNETGGIALVYGDGKVTGLDGESYHEFVNRYGAWINMPSATYNDFAAKGH